MSNIKRTVPKKQATKEDKLRRIGKHYSEFSGFELTFKDCYHYFRISQIERGNSKATLDFYDRFYKKLLAMYGGKDDIPIDMMTQPGHQALFMATLGEVGQQTVNSYLRGYRAFGNWCEEEGYLDGFKCPIKEVEPPVKQVYTDDELRALLVRPSEEDFEEYRNYCIISTILGTGARANTILNIRLCDVDINSGYITFNTTKAHKVVRLGLQKKLKRDLHHYIRRYRSSMYDDPEDYLFVKDNREQLSRSGLNKAIKEYNERRGVEKTSIHLMRHTFAKNWITSGGDIITLAKVLTHSELEMVKRYANLYGSDVKAELEEHAILSNLKGVKKPTIKQERKLKK